MVVIRNLVIGNQFGKFTYPVVRFTVNIERWLLIGKYM